MSVLKLRDRPHPRLCGFLLLLACALPASAADESTARALAQDILGKLTIEEKVSLCAGNSTFAINAIPRVGLTEEFTMSDGPHTVRPDCNRMTFAPLGGNHDFSTSLPPLSALAATWDTALADRFGRVLGEEARDRGKDMILGPGVNIMRTPLCGRNFEYLGEDPMLAGIMAVPLIQGIQINDVAACVKHFACNNQELNRNKVDVEVSERALREIYLPAFEAAVHKAGVLTLMSGYNQLRGSFCSHSDYLNNQILKKEWGFQGFVVTDWGGLHDTVAGALGGTDVEMNAGDQIKFFRQPLLDAVKAGTVPIAVLDDKVMRLLTVMARIDKIGGGTRPVGSRNTPAHQQAARDIAAAGIVLLKNDQSILPLKTAALQRVTVFGDNAWNKHCGLGWSAAGKPPYEISPLEGLRARLGTGVEITCESLGNGITVSAIPDNCITTVDSHVKNAGMTIHAWQAEYFANKDLTGKSDAQNFDRDLDFNWQGGSPRQGIPGDAFSARWNATVVPPEDGAYQFGVQTSGRSRVFVDDQLVVDAWKGAKGRLVTGEIALKAGQPCRIRVEYGTLKPDNLAFRFGWCPPGKRSGDLSAAIAKAKSADAVLVFTGNEHGHGRAKESEGGDRPSLQLPEGQDDAVAAILAAIPKAVVVNLSGAPVEMPWIQAAPTVVQYWFSGQEGGNALASVLVGDVNPSGHLPCTFPAKLADCSVQHESLKGERVVYSEGILVGYRWFDTKNIEPLFPFGHGLSYTTFAIGSPVIASPKIAPGGTCTIDVAVTNTGATSGATVVQCYVADSHASVPRPMQELKGFRKVFLQPGERRIVSMDLTCRDLAFWDETTQAWKAEPGQFEVRVGDSSRRISGTATVTLTGVWRP